MIRDPSDGSVKTKVDEKAGFSSTRTEIASQANGLMSSTSKPSSANNWGLKSLDQPVRKPAPAPTKEQLEAHYREFGLGFQRKEEGAE